MRPIPLVNPSSRWAATQVVYDAGQEALLGLQVFEDHSRSVVSSNDSPDLPFRFSVNPYRGCAHGCAYCYARPTHEHLGFGGGGDFERRIVVKPRAAELLRAEFERPSWQGELLMFSGVTDCYQPLESRLGLTRACLEVCLEYGNPVHVVTKAALVERDLELLRHLHERASAAVSISVTSWDDEVSRALEPYAPPPARRIETIRRLSSVGLPVMLHVAPVIPGLTDRDVLPILQAARDAGATAAMMLPVRLPGSSAQVFEARLREAFPLRAERVIGLIREMRGGKLNDPRFGLRHHGEGSYMHALHAMFAAAVTRLGYAALPPPKPNCFRRPSGQSGQLSLAY